MHTTGRYTIVSLINTIYNASFSILLRWSIVNYELLVRNIGMSAWR